MANINEILARAAALRQETALNSIDPERAGGIMYDTLLALNELWLQQGAALVISKIYASVAAMNADTSPVSDLTGKPIRPGMVVVIASSDSDNGSVYRYNGTSAPRWSLVGKIGNITPEDSLTSDSTQIPLAAHQGKVLDGKISQLGQKVDGTLDNGTIYNTFDSTNRVCVYFPIPDVDAEYYLSVTDEVVESGSTIIKAIRSAATPYTASWIFNIPNNSSFTIPEQYKANAKYIAITTTLANSPASFKVYLYISNSLKQRIDAIEPRLDDLESFEENQKSTNDSTKQMLSYMPVDVISEDIAEAAIGWWAYSDGVFHGSSNLRYYIIPNNGYKWIKLIVASTDTNPCAVAFYNSATPGADSYMQASSVQMKVGVNEYLVNVPEGCVTMCVTNRPSLLETPVILCTKNDIGEGVELIKKELDSRYSREWLQKPFYGHLWIGTIDGRHPAIPCQSLFDIDATARLGFKYIEANVHYTSDGVPISIHGASGRFGREVTDLNGDFTYENTAINSVTYDWIKSNLIYDSKYAKHRTTIPTLEEFFTECKLRGMSVFVTYDSDVYALAKQYFGDNFLAYQGNRDDGFTGIIVQYSSLTDMDDIIAECKRIRPPYIHEISTTAFATIKAAGTLPEIAKAVHEAGCLLAIAGCYMGNDVVYFFENGGDVSASDREINEFQSGNICNLKGDIDFSQFTITNGSVSDGVVTLQNGGTIVSPQYDSIYLGKVSLHIRFSGTLTIRLNGANRQIVSDGKHSVWISSYILENAPGLTITSVGVTEITSIDYKASVV